MASWELENSALGGLDTEDHASPTLGDIDKDGDADLIVGGGFGTLFLLKNNGTKFNPIWSSTIEAKYANIGIGYKATPQLADFDCDGWVDLLIGSDYGASIFYKNKGPFN